MSSKSKSNANAMLAERAAALQTEIDLLEAALGDEDPQKIVSRHIKLLHEYNEAKDAAQMLMGKIAGIKQTTVKQLHEDYGLELDD
ncbi:hypothetical protein BOTBODRAFT_176827 [Botryobasidium botryosum FD-172 SS1]|uniref:DNA repair protein SWI5 homolog n=1 Tax=Botryobasidium botryosum (strain FD-172 SS1) TaxID=930990 RepID=A0A067M912_BOTB1|nr:hypothetical protein BOTBODRAFT_176827 [Botryobasidium botryosum FD-172 SS1]